MQLKQKSKGRGLQACDSNVSFNKFYRYLTRNETTYVPPTLSPLSVENWFPELDDSQKVLLNLDGGNYGVMRQKV